MSIVVSPGSNLPLPVGISEGQQFLTNHLLRFRSGVEADGLGGPINFAHEIPNRSPRNVFDDVLDVYTEFGLRRYRCYYIFNSHYTLAIPNIVVYLESSSVNPKSKISFAFGTSEFNGQEQSIPSQFHEPAGVTWNSAEERSKGTFLTEPLKPRNWKAFWVREILDFDSGNTEFNFYVLRFETANPISVTGAPDFNMTFVGNMGCGTIFQNILNRMINRNPTAIFTLGNNSYNNTAECWLQRISPVRSRIRMAFGAYDWYIAGQADEVDDTASPTIPKDWFWPEAERGCGGVRYAIHEGANNTEVDPVEVSERHEVEDDEDTPIIWQVTVWDVDDDEETGEVSRGDEVEEQWYFGQNEENARAYAAWLKTCQVTEGELDKSNFNLQIQNQYRNFFGINNFDGYQSYYANNIHFLILNTNAITRGHQEDSPQYRFAEEQLKRAVDNAFIDYRIVIAYRPGYTAPTGSLGGGGLGYQGPMRSFNELYKPLFEKYHVTLYINGNVKNYQRTGILKFDSGNWIEPNEQSPTSGPIYTIKGRSLDGDGIIYVTVGTGGGIALQSNEGLPLWVKRSFQNFGYLLMTSVMNGQQLQFRFYDDNDNLKDFFSVGKETFTFSPSPNPPLPAPNLIGYSFAYKFGEAGTGDGDFSNIPGEPGIEGICVDPVNFDIYVIDAGAHRLQVFSNNGTFLRKWGSLGSGNGQFDSPYSVKIDSEGFVWVMDQHNDRLQKFTKSGDFILAKSTFPGANPTTLHHPEEFAFDPIDGSIYISDTDQPLGPRIVKIDKNLNFVREWNHNGQLEHPHGLSVGLDQNVYVGNHHDEIIRVFDKDGNHLRSWGTQGSGPGQLQDTKEGNHVDRAGRVYQMNTEPTYCIVVFDTFGKFLFEVGQRGPASAEDGKFNEPEMCVTDVNQKLYVTDSRNSRVQVFNPIFSTAPGPTPAPGQPPVPSVTFDSFGIRQMYQTKVRPGVMDVWESTSWATGAERVIEGGCEDSDGPVHVANAGSPDVRIMGDGTMRAKGESPRITVVGDAWENVEETVYIKALTTNAERTPEGWSLRPKSDHYCVDCGSGVEDNGMCFGGYIVNYESKPDPGKFDFRKEQAHDIGYSGRKNEAPISLPEDQWIGCKAACYRVPVEGAPDHVKIEAWIDRTGGVNGGTWESLGSFTDDGANMTVNGVDYDPWAGPTQGSAIRFNALPPDEGGTDFAEYYVKWWSVREILRPGETQAPTQPPTPPPSGGQLMEDGVKMFYPKIDSENFSFSSGSTDRAQWVANLDDCFVNLEVTGYLKIDEVNDDSEEVSIKLRGGPHTDSDPDAGSCYIIGIGYDGSVNSQYEEPHPSNHSMSFTTITNRPLGNDITGRWFGIKAIVYKIPDEDRDKIECWIDPGGLDSNGNPENQWVKFWETKSDQFTGECNGDGDERAYFRLDEIPGGDDEENVELRFASCRNIRVD